MERLRVQPGTGIHDETEGILAPGFQAVHDGCNISPSHLDILYELHVLTQGLRTVTSPKSEVIPSDIRKRLRLIQYCLLSNENLDDFGTSEDHLSNACQFGVLMYIGIIQNEFWSSSITTQLTHRLKIYVQRESFVTESMRALRLWLIFLAGCLVLDPRERSWLVYHTS